MEIINIILINTEDNITKIKCNMVVIKDKAVTDKIISEKLVQAVLVAE